MGRGLLGIVSRNLGDLIYSPFLYSITTQKNGDKKMYFTTDVSNVEIIREFFTRAQQQHPELDLEYNLERFEDESDNFRVFVTSKDVEQTIEEINAFAEITDVSTDS